MAPRPRPDVDRFAEKIALTDNGCVEWIAGTNGTGYGQFGIGPRSARKKVYVHRWSYEHHVGPIPEGLVIDHLCGNRLCVLPAHLEAVTQRVNLARANDLSTRNANKARCPAGHVYAGDNLYIYRWSRMCRACRRAAGRRYYASRKAA